MSPEDYQRYAILSEHLAKLKAGLKAIENPGKARPVSDIQHLETSIAQLDEKQNEILGKIGQAGGLDTFNHIAELMEQKADLELAITQNEAVLETLKDGKNSDKFAQSLVDGQKEKLKQVVKSLGETDYSPEVIKLTAEAGNLERQILMLRMELEEARQTSAKAEFDALRIMLGDPKLPEAIKKEFETRLRQLAPEIQNRENAITDPNATPIPDEHHLN
jgi:hypothetical protein